VRSDPERQNLSLDIKYLTYRINIDILPFHFTNRFWGIMRSTWFLCALVSLSAFAQEANVPPLEVWWFQPKVQVENLTSETDRGDVVLASDPKVEALRMRESLSVSEVRFAGDRLTIGKVQGKVSIGELKASKSVLGAAVNLFSFRDVEIEVATNQAVELVLPEKALLQLVNEEGMTRFDWNDPQWKAELDQQIETKISESLFTVTLSGGLNDIAKGIANELIQKQKPELLKQAREELKKAMNSQRFSELLSLRQLPSLKALAPVVAEKEWRLSKYQVSGAILWRLAPANAGPSAYDVPRAAVGSQNWVTLVASPQLLQSIAESALQTMPPLDASQSAAIAALVGLSIEENGSIQLQASGERGPKVRFWSNVSPSNEKKSYMDVLLCLIGDNGEEVHVGAVLEFLPEGVPQIRKLIPLENGDSESIRSLLASVAWEALSQRVNQSLAEAFGRLSAQGTGSTLKSVRSVGEAGLRNAGTASSQATWAKGLAIDLQLP
jgi:hypothetical protein